MLKTKKKKDYLLFSELLLCVLIINGVIVFSSTVMLQILPRNQVIGFTQIFIQLLIEMLAISIILFYYQKKNLHILSERYSSEATSFLMMYLFLVMLLITYAAHYYDAYDHFVIGIDVFLIIQTLFVIYLFMRVLNQQKEKYETQIAKKELDHLKAYTEVLEKNQQQIAKFRHDYKNLLLSFKEASSTGQNAKLTEQIETLEDYSNRSLPQDEFDYKALYNIQNSFIKSLLIAKLHRAKELKIQCHFECQEPIETLPMPIFDGVRMLGILLDNALEAAAESRDKVIDIMIYQDDSQIEFLIKNTYEDASLALDQLQQKGHSTKAGHSGLGLNTVQEFKQKYTNLFVQYQRVDSVFSTQVILMKD
ncbi:sensor histidine kinase [Latilactobacillus fuchuensis]|nr:GHKL domain-containing protein [Latilactobacillus fuchuensis]